MSKNRKKPKAAARPVRAIARYDHVLSGMVELLESARRASARAVNAVMTATYWEIGRRIVECEQQGKGKADYGEELIDRLSRDLTKRFGRGFGRRNLFQIRAFYVAYSEIVQTPSAQLGLEGIVQTVSAQSGPQGILQTLSGESGPEGTFQTVSEKSEPKGILQTVPAKSSGGRETEIFQTASGKSRPRGIVQTVSEESGPGSKGQAPSGLSDLAAIAQRFPLPWSAYVRLLSVADAGARAFYEAEALRCGWSVRQLDRQIATLFYERTLLSRNKAAMLRKGEVPRPEEIVTPEEEIKDPLVLEFLGLKDEYSESQLEEALIVQLEQFLLELGGDFAFVARQRRLRVGAEWYRVDLLFFHRRLRCLIVIDLKVDKLTHADAGQMHMYLNYARENWVLPGENPPVGLILCTDKDAAVAKYALEGLSSKVLAAEYQMALPDPQTLADELTRTRRLLEARRPARPKGATS